MFGIFKKKSRKRKPAAKKKQPQRPAPAVQHTRPTVGEVYNMVKKTKDMLDSIPDLELIKAKCAMNNLEDLLWQAVNK